MCNVLNQPLFLENPKYLMFNAVFVSLNENISATSGK